MLNNYANNDNSNQQQRREFVELLARAAAEDEQSGAFGLFDFLKTGAKIIGGLIGGRYFPVIFNNNKIRLNRYTNSNNQQRRELVELLARAAEDDQSGAFGLFDILKTGAKIIGGLIGYV